MKRAVVVKCAVGGQRMNVRHGREDFRHEPLREDERAFLVAGGADVALFAGDTHFSTGVTGVSVIVCDPPLGFVLLVFEVLVFEYELFEHQILSYYYFKTDIA